MPGPWVRIVPVEDVVLYVEDVVYNPHSKIWYVELSFIPEETEDESDLAVEDIAQFEIDLEVLFPLGWMPLMIEDLESSDDEAPVSTSRPH